MISANRRSGIFVKNGFEFSIANNVIGLDAKHLEDRGNGASGIYFGVDPLVSEVSGTISGNFIAFNHDFGIAVDAGDGVDIGPNSIFANWQMGIDNGLDGPTTTPINAILNLPPLPPVITSAAYDPASDTTQIEGSFASRCFSTLQFYANDAPHHSGYGDGQYYIGTQILGCDHAFRFTARGDWRGKWVSATGTIHHGVEGEIPSTSEFSRAVEVH